MSRARLLTAVLLVLTAALYLVGLDRSGWGNSFYAADARTLYRVYLGELSMAQAEHANQLQLVGEPVAVRQLPHWFSWSTFAPAVRAADQRRAAVTSSSPS